MQGALVVAVGFAGSTSRDQLPLVAALAAGRAHGPKSAPRGPRNRSHERKLLSRRLLGSVQRLPVSQPCFTKKSSGVDQRTSIESLVVGTCYRIVGGRHLLPNAR